MDYAIRKFLREMSQNEAMAAISRQQDKQRLLHWLRAKQIINNNTNCQYRYKNTKHK